MISESEIIELAKKFGFETRGVHPESMTFYQKQLIAFATEIRNRTLDEAAGVCDEHEMGYEGTASGIKGEILALKGDEK